MLDPNIDLFQRLSLDESLRRTIAVYRAGFLIFTQIAGLFLTVTSTVWVLLLFVLLPAFDVDGSKFTDPYYMMEHKGAYFALLGINMLVVTLVGAVGNGAMIRAVADLYVQREPTFKGCLQTGIQKACTILMASFLSTLGASAGYILLFVPGVYLSVTWFLVNPVIVVESLSVMSSLKRSYELVSGSWCYVFCMFLIAYSIMLVLQLIWGAIFTGGNDAGHTMFSFSGSIIASIPSIIFGPMFAIIMSIMYINLRIEKEGLNADVLARNLGITGSDTGGTATYSPLMKEDDGGEAAGQSSLV